MKNDSAVKKLQEEQIKILKNINTRKGKIINIQKEQIYTFKRQNRILKDLCGGKNEDGKINQKN